MKDNIESCRHPHRSSISTQLFRTWCSVSRWPHNRIGHYSFCPSAWVCGEGVYSGVDGCRMQRDRLNIMLHDKWDCSIWRSSRKRPCATSPLIWELHDYLNSSRNFDFTLSLIFVILLLAFGSTQLEASLRCSSE